MVPPDLVAARRAPDAILKAGADTVLLFGKIARGEVDELADAGAHFGIDWGKSSDCPQIPPLSRQAVHVGTAPAHSQSNCEGLPSRWDWQLHRSSTAPSAVRINATSTVPAWMRRTDSSD